MKKPELFIHGGIHKTGTTSLQHFLSINTTPLLNNSVLYPKTGRDELEQHHYFFSSLKNLALPDFKPKKKFQEYLIVLNEEILITKPEKVILSSEIFCELIDEDFSFLKHNLSELFGLFSSAKIIFYLRRPDLFGVSANNTGIWFGKKKKHTLWYPLLLKWTEILDKNQLIFRPFEKKQFVSENLYLDFLETIKIQNKEDFNLPSENQNESLDDNLLELLRIVNNSHPDITKDHRFKTKLIEAFPSHGKASDVFFSAKERFDFIKKFDEDNQIIAKEFLCREDGQLYFEPLPDPEETYIPYNGLPVETVVSAFSYLLFKQQEQIDLLAKRISEFDDKY